jgi:hypothetical protein
MTLGALSKICLRRDRHNFPTTNFILKILWIHIAANLFIIFAQSLYVHTIFVIIYFVSSKPSLQDGINTENVKLRDEPKPSIVLSSVYTKRAVRDQQNWTPHSTTVSYPISIILRVSPYSVYVGLKIIGDFRRKYPYVKKSISRCEWRRGKCQLSSSPYLSTTGGDYFLPAYTNLFPVGDISKFSHWISDWLRHSASINTVANKNPPKSPEFESGTLVFQPKVLIYTETGLSRMIRSTVNLSNILYWSVTAGVNNFTSFLSQE